MNTNIPMCSVQSDAVEDKEEASGGAPHGAEAVVENDDPVIFLSGPGVLHMHSYDLVKTSEFQKQIRALKALKEKGLLKIR